MTALADFFGGSETTLGVFYPNHHVVAVFRDLKNAQRGADRLRDAGFPSDAVIAVSGVDVIQFDRTETGLTSFLMQAASRFFKTEQSFTDHDLEHARQGAGFLVVRCTTDAEKNRAWKAIEPEKPIDARYYSTGAIEHLAGDVDTD